jgi:hypothetical protein
MRISPGAAAVPTAQVSDIPQPSASSMPRAWKNSSTSRGVGAAPTTTSIASSRPTRERTNENSSASAFRTAASRSGGTGIPAWRKRTRSNDAAMASCITTRCSSGCDAICASSPAFIFSQMRGTAKKNVGFTFGR